MQTQPLERALELSNAELADAEGVLALTQRITVETPVQYTAAAEALQDVKAKQKELDGLRKDITGPLNDTIKRINALFGKPLDKLQAAERVIKSALLGYQDKVAREEQAKLQAAVVASAAGNRAAAVQLIANAHTDTHVAGLSTRDLYKFEVTDPTLVPREFLMVNESAVGAIVRATKGTAVIPGVRIYTEKTVASRSAAS